MPYVYRLDKSTSVKHIGKADPLNSRDDPIVQLIPDMYYNLTSGWPTVYP